MRHYFYNPKTKRTFNILNGRSLWEDQVDKADYIIVQEVGPAMEHCEEVMKQNTHKESSREKLVKLIERAEARDASNHDKRALMRAVEELVG